MIHSSHDAVDLIFAASNLAIAAGYAAIPILVLPYLKLRRRRILVFGAGFFLLCGTTHVAMAFGHSHVPVNWWWTAEHVAQAVCTWGFILTFHQLLRAAHRLREDRSRVRTEPPPAPEGVP